ncbi:MAG: hypothetical protein ACT4O3_03780 [Elusimicrobiota bacterium]
MKKLILAVGLAAGLAASVQAAEWPENPDRFPSVGLNYTGIFQSGDTKYDLIAGGSASQDLSIDENYLVADLRLPVSNRMTLTGGLGFAGFMGELTKNAAAGADGQEQDATGVLVNLGVRFYIH